MPKSWGIGETLSARYAPSWLAEGEWLDAGETLDRDEARERFAAALAASMAQERARHRALVGPHADRIEFFVEGRPVGVYGSQGQQRSAVLAFKLAEVTLICDLLGQQPVLLLDDVMSELDEQRRPRAGEVRLRGYPNVYNHGEPGVFRRGSARSGPRRALAP